MRVVVPGRSGADGRYPIRVVVPGRSGADGRDPIRVVVPGRSGADGRYPIRVFVPGRSGADGGYPNSIVTLCARREGVACMADGELPRRTVSSSTRLTPEEIVNRGFSSAFRGVSETEVRNFLKRVADEFGALRERERDLAARVEQLEDRLRHPPPPTEQHLPDSLGGETARVLRSAQEAAGDIRKKAQERAEVLQRESQDERH